MERSAPRLILDIQATQSHDHHDRGIARFVREQARLLLERDAVAAMLLNPHLRFPLQMDQQLLTSPLLEWNTATVLRRVIAKAEGPLAYYVMSPFELSPWANADLPTHAIGSGLPLVTTLYDLIPLLRPDDHLTDPDRAARYHARLELLEHVDLVLSISESTTRDAVDRLDLDPSRIERIGAGVSPSFSPAPPHEDPRRSIRHQLPALRGGFVLTVGGEDPRKNTERLIEAWARVPEALRTERQLVVCCRVSDERRRAWEACADDAGLRHDEVVFTGWVDDEVLRSLYRAADLFVFGSLYEGFGLPAAEALACGCPVVTSSTSSLPEVLAWPDATFDPTDVAAMAAVIRRALDDQAFRRELLARGAARRRDLTWDAVVDRTLDAVAAHLGSDTTEQAEAPPAPPTPPVTLALVGPMPPLWSGIADYNARLLRPLAARCRLDVFTATPRPEAFADLDIGWFPVEALGQALNPYSYDAVVYTIGNSDDHHDLYEMALNFPGLVWWHDVRVPGLYLTYAQDRVPKGQGRDFLEDRLRRQYRRRVPFVPTGDIDDEISLPYTDAGLGLSRELVDANRGVVVSSELASRLLCLDQGPDARTTPAWVVPLGAPTPSEAPVRRSDPGAGPVVASFGMVAPAKGAELLVASIPSLLALVPDARLVLVGPVEDHYRAVVEDLACRLGVGDRVEITGHLPVEEYESHLTTATCAAQLRLSTNGESSAAVLDCLAAGLPVVTSVAATAELPTGTVELIPHDIEAVDLGTLLGGLLLDPDRLASLARAGRVYAGSWGLDDVAGRLLDIVSSLGSTGATSPG